MIHSFPVVEREMRTAARQPWTFYLRSFVAGVAMVACCLVLVLPRVSPTDCGVIMLVSLSILGMAFCLLSGCFLTADCISGEKRDGTLGLLLLTPLRGVDLILGKMAAHSLRAWLGLLAIFPLFFMPLLLGGTTWSEVVRVLISLLVTMFLSLSVGLLFSTLGENSRGPVLGTFLVVILITVLPLVVWTGMNELFRIKPSAALYFSPAAMLAVAFEEGQKATSNGAQRYWGSVSLLTILSGVALMIACELLPRQVRQAVRGDVKKDKDSEERPPADQQDQDPSLAEAAGDAHESMAQVPPAARRRPGRGGKQDPSGMIRLTLLDECAPHPYEWRLRRASRPSRMVKGVYVGALSLFGLSLFASVATRQWEFWFTTAFFTALGIHVTTKFLMALESTRWMHEDCRSGALELLLATPFEEASIVGDQNRALRHLFRRPLRLLLTVNFALMVTAVLFSDHLHIRGDEAMLFHIFFAGGILAAWADLGAMRWLGPWFGLVSSTHLKAMVRVVAVLMLPSWVCFGGIFMVSTTARYKEEEFAVLLLLWFGGSALCAWIVKAWAQAQFRHRFRTVAAGLKPETARWGLIP